MQLASIVLGGSPGTGGAKVKLAALRALRTLIQAIVSAFPSAGAGVVVLSTGYWQTFGYACIAAVITAVIAFLQNISKLLPADPGQTTPV